LEQVPKRFLHNLLVDEAMKARLPHLLAVITILSAFSVALAEADDLKSGPQPGQLLPGPFHPFNVSGEHANHPHCLVCDFGLKPAVMVFVRDSAEVGKPVLTFLQKLDETVGKYQDVRLKAFTVFLSEDYAKPETRKQAVARVDDIAKKADLKYVVLAVDGPSGPEAYHLSKTADVTVILYEKHKVIANFAFAKDKLGDADIETILAVVAKLGAAK
jgi:hypothetical protein